MPAWFSRFQEEVATLSGKEAKTPEFLQLRGYKYRAKMLIAGAVLLIVFILIISMIIHGIASAVRSVSGGKNEPDTETTASISSAESQPQSAPAVSSDPAESDTASSEVDSRVTVDEKFDADNKLIIDTDTLDGKKAVAITFDDGPSEYTRELIEGLNERGARATFFMVGSCVEQYPDVLPLMVTGGHQLGNHTYDHSDITTLTADGVRNTIGKTDDAIFNACGQRSTAFRPPYGSYTDEIAKSINKTVTIWSLDTVDWKSRDMKKIKNTMVSQCRDGSIVLLHDLYKTSVDGALAAIDELQGEGFVFVTVDELLTRYGYPVNPGAHSSQYAVYETNSPHADEYAEDMERDKEKDAAASQAAGSFYYDRQTDSDTDTSSSTEDTYNGGEEDIKVIESESDSDALIY